MAVWEGGVSASLAGVDSQVYTPAHVLAGPFPVGAGGAYRLSMTSGTIAASLGANSELFQFRYLPGGSRVCLVYGITVSAAEIVSQAVSTIVNQSLRATIARAWTVAGSGGTRATMTGNNQKLRTSHATSEVNDIGIATTAALTAGTKTLDSQDIGAIVTANQTGAAVADSSRILFPQTNLLGEFQGGLGSPLILANQEGFVVRIGAAMPATLTWNLTVGVLWSEVNSF